VMLVAWFVVAVASPVMGSIAVFSITNVALICYALSAKYELMETNRWRLASQAVVETSPSTSNPVGMETQLISPTDEAPVPPTQLIVMEDEQPKQPSTSEMLTEKDPLSHGYELETEEQNNNMATTIAIDIDMSTAAQIVIDEDMLRTQLPPPVVDLNTQLPPAEAPKISIDTSTLRSKPAPKEPPVIKLDLGDIRNQRTVRLSGDAPKPSPSDEEKPED
jgi:hypothetical protein